MDFEQSLPSNSHFYSVGENYKSLELYGSPSSACSTPPPPPPPDSPGPGRGLGSRRVVASPPITYSDDDNEIGFNNVSNPWGDNTAPAIMKSVNSAGSTNSSRNLSGVPQLASKLSASSVADRPVTPKAFLKRGSRKEPTSLNRIPQTIKYQDKVTTDSTDPTKADQKESDKKDSMKLQSKQQSKPAVDVSESRYLSRPKESVDSTPKDDIIPQCEGNDIILEGSAYWNLDVVPPSGSRKDILESTFLQNNEQEIKHRQKQVSSQLDEFALLEKQVEMELDDAGLGTLERPNTGTDRANALSNSRNTIRQGPSKAPVVKPANPWDTMDYDSEVGASDDERHHNSDEPDYNFDEYSLEMRYQHLNSQRQLDRSPKPSGSHMDVRNKTSDSTGKVIDQQPSSSRGRGLELGVTSQSFGHPVRGSFSSIDTSVDIAAPSAVEKKSPLDSREQNGGIVRTRPSMGGVNSSNNNNSNNSIAATSASSYSLQFASSGQQAVRASSTGRAKTPINAKPQTPNGRPVSAGRPQAADKHNPIHPQSQGDQPLSNDYLTTKARELEAEIEIYKQDNAKLKEIKKQQAATLAEITKERDEVLRWTSEEKTKVLAWCEDQRQQINRERRQIAKLSRENRAATGVTIRKERAEIEALQATIEKMKIDDETVIKKLKMSEKRLMQLSREQSTKISELQTQLTECENDKHILLSFVEKIPTKLPSAIIKLLGKVGSTMRDNNVISRTKVKDGFVEIVDADALADTATTSSFAVIVNNTSNSNINGSTPRSSARPLSSGGNGINFGSSDYLRLGYNDYQDAELFPSKSGQLSTALFGRGGQGSSMTADSSQQLTLEPRVDGHDPASNVSRIAADSNWNQSDDVNASWARSSKSSRGSRYSSQGDSDNDEAEQDSDVIYNNALAGNSSSSSKHNSFDRRLNEILPDSYAKTSQNYGVGIANALSLTSRNASSTSSALPQFQAVDPVQTSRPRSAATLAATTGHSVSHHEDVKPTVDGLSATASQVVKESSDVTSKIVNMSATASSSSMPNSTPTSSQASAGRSEVVLADGRRRISYRNGTIKDVFPDGKSVVKFQNGDTKRTNPDNGTVIYYYAQAQTTHTTYPDGLEVYEFPNNQIEKHFKNGTKEISFPDGTKKVITADGVQENHFSDGIIVREYPDGKKDIINSTRGLKPS